MKKFKRTLQALSLIVVLAACDSNDAPSPSSTVGTILVEVATSGSEPDSDGYTLMLDADESRELEPNDSVTFEDLEDGARQLELTGVAENCSVAGDNPQSAAVTAGETTDAQFEVHCTAPLATVDGVRSPGEWDDATAVAFSGAEFLYQNDGQNLYLALEIIDATRDDGNRFQIRFDNAHDGSLDAGEDNLQLVGSGSFGDLSSYASGGSVYWGLFDGQQDGEGAVGRSGDTYFFEMVHPLDSGDQNDFSLSSGDVVGYCALYRDAPANTSIMSPAGCVAAGSDLSGYAELTIE